MEQHHKHLSGLGLQGEELKRALDPLRSFHLQLEEEVSGYEQLMRGDLGELLNLHGLGYMLVALRIARGLTQRELAARLNTHESQVSRDERNEYHGITVERASRVLDALGAGILELTAASAPRDLDPRSLAAARIIASLTAGCPFCLDMNAATWRRAKLSADDLSALLSADPLRWEALGAREAAAARYAHALSLTPAHVSPALQAELRDLFSPREIVVLAATIAQVNMWSRFGEGLGVPPLGMAAAAQCPVSLPEPP